VPIQFLKGPHLRLFLGAVLISLSPVWVKLVSISPTTSGFYRVAIGSVTVAILMVFARQKLRLSKRAWMLVGLAGAFFSLDLFFWHRSIIYVGPGLSTLLANFQVFIMMSAGVVLLRQKPSATQLLAVPLALLGLVMIVGLDWQSLPGDYRLGVIFGLLTAIMYAGYLLSLRAARVNSESRLPLSEVAVVSIVCTLLLVLIAQSPRWKAYPSPCRIPQISSGCCATGFCHTVLVRSFSQAVCRTFPRPRRGWHCCCSRR
jgi:drug/metabolite transporter (DMT)-like permease